jgi:hypothetical protein
MRVVEVRPIEDCLDGSIIREFVLDQGVDFALVERLGKVGHLRYFADFARPLFIVTAEDRFKIKGVEGSSTLTVICFDAKEPGLIGWLRQKVAGED